MNLKIIFLSILVASQQSSEINKNNVLFGTTTESIQAQYDKAIELIYQEKNKEAITILTQITEVDPSFVHAFFKLGEIYLKLNNYKEAQNYFNKSINLAPDFADAYFALGNIYYIQQSLDQALKTFTKFLELDPQSAEGHHNYAATLREMGELEESIPHFKKSIELNNKFEKAYLNLGDILNNLGREQESIKYLKQAIILNETSENAHYTLGVVYQKQDKQKKAIKAFQRVIKLNPTNKEAHFQLATCLLAIDDIDKAQQHLDTALFIDENYILALVSRGLLKNQLQESQNPYKDLQKAYELIQNETLIIEQNIAKEKITQLQEMFKSFSPQDKKKIKFTHEL